MGRGDRRTRRGKIWKHSFGKARPRKAAVVAAKPAAVAAAPAKKKAEKKSG